jgi:hypothetical protein
MDLVEAGETWQESDDLPVLYRRLAKVLKLAPDAHSSGPKRARPKPRHAELAVNLAGAMATFLVSTWQARQEAAAPRER